MRTLITTILFFFTSVLYSQVETRYFDKPADLDEISGGHIQELPIVKAVTTISTSEVQEMMIQCKRSDTPTTERYGYPIDVSYTLNDGMWYDVEGGRIWSMTFISNNASSLNFSFSNLSIPKGAEIYIVSKDNCVVFGPITCDVINKNGLFLTDLIPGEESTIYLYEPTGSLSESTFLIEKIIHGSPQKQNRGEDGNRVDINFYNTFIACEPDWVDSSKGVAAIYSSAGTVCGNGTLMMSTDLSFKPYILLSFDKIDSNGDHSLSTSEISTAENWAFRFNKRYTDCNGTSTLGGISFNGATLRSYCYDSGFALMELNNEIKSSGIRWQGWDRSSNTPSQGVCIYSDNYGFSCISSENHSLNSIQCMLRSQAHWVIGLWDSGHSFGGKEGAPLFNQDHRVVGHLNHLYPDYFNLTSEICFGKISSSWTGNGTNSTRLSNWLDPVGTGQTTINSSLRVIIDGSDIVCGTALYCLLHLDSSYSVTWSFKNASYLNSLITTVPSDPTMCYVTASGSTTIDNILVATLWRNGITIGSVEKHIMTPKQLTGTISQTGGSVPGYTYPSFTTSIEPITAVNQFCHITIHSPKIKHMSVSCITNPQTTVNIQQIDDETIGFYAPSGSDNIGIHLYFTGNGNCNNFDLRLIALRDPIDPSNPYYINMDGNLLEIGMTGNKEPGQEYAQRNYILSDIPLSWSLEVYKATTGKKIFGQEIEGTSYSLDTTGWEPGVYIVKATIGDQELTEKVIVK